jgi:triphosphoribosyl-dephospho-CoA synthase
MQTGRLSTPRMRDTTPRWQHSQRLAAFATRALIAEAELTPKPGLVDQRGAGAHHDLSLDLMRRSANVLQPYFATMVFVSAGRNVEVWLRQELAAIGRAAERAMFRATFGSNTHKGAIWTLGLLVAAAARAEHQNAAEIPSMAGAIARLPLRALPASITHGDVARMRYGAVGARGEAWNGFPHVTGYGLPVLRERRRAGCSEEVSRLDALLAMMARLDDTCVLYRGGAEALSLVKSGAKAVLAAGGYGHSSGRRQLRQLDRELIARHISPGGSADLLAATILLDALERDQSAAGLARSQSEDIHGTV